MRHQQQRGVREVWHLEEAASQRPRPHEELLRRNQKKLPKTKSTYVFPAISGAVPSPPPSLSNIVSPLTLTESPLAPFLLAPS